MQNNPEVASPDLLAASRESLVESHIVHEFEPARVLDNLAGCYGTLIQGVYREMLPLLKGGRIIDCGCGFGQFSHVAINAGFEVTSIDIDDASLAIAREVSRIPCRRESIYATSLPDGSCDTAVCCDSIQHFDIREFRRELKRLGVQRIVIYDSNISNPLLALYRGIVGHRETTTAPPTRLFASFASMGMTSLRCATRMSSHCRSVAASNGDRCRSSIAFPVRSKGSTGASSKRYGCCDLIAF